MHVRLITLSFICFGCQQEKPDIKWDEVAGLEGAKEALKEAGGRDRCSIT